MRFKPYLLTLRNFQGFGNNTTEVRLDFDSPTLIVGRNYDSVVDGQLDSNGAGKTTVLNAMTYALFDKLISDKGVKQDDIINNINKKNMLVELIFEVDGVFYKVQRFRKHKDLGGTGVNVFKRTTGKWDDEFLPEHDVTTARDGSAKPDDELKNAIGMEFEVFSRIVAFSASHTPFLMLPMGDQTEIVENIAGLSELTIDADNIKKRSKADSITLERLREVNNTIKVQRVQIEGQIESAVTRALGLDAANKADIDRVTDELKELNTVDFEEQIAFFEYIEKVQGQIAVHQQELREDKQGLEANTQKITKANNWQVQHDEKLATAKTNVDALPDHDYATIRKQLESLAAVNTRVADITALINTAKREKNTKLEIVKSRTEELAHLADSKCPYCTQQLQDAQKRTSLAMIARDKAQEEADVIQVTIDGHELDLGLDVAEQDKLAKALLFCKFNSDAQVSSAERLADSVRATYDRLLAEENPYADVKVPKLEAANEVFRENIEISEAAITKKTAKVREYTDMLVYDTMKALLTDQARVDAVREKLESLKNFVNPLLSTIDDLRAVKLEETKDDEIALLESDIEHQQFLVKLLTKKDSFIRKTLLQKSIPFMNARLRYYLDRIGLPHKVAFQEDLSVKISQFGNTIGFGIISSGQKARINIALAFTFRDMLQLRHGRLNFCILDECLDVGLGNVGVQLVAKMIKQIAQEEKLSMFIISHRDEIANMFDRTMIVELRSGFSNIVEQ